MQLKTLDGIACDNCGETFRHDFIYFSYDIKPVTIVTNNRPPLDHMLNFETLKSLDICCNCHNINATTILKNQSAKSNRCELSGTHIINTLYYCVVAKVYVNLSSGNTMNVNNRYLEFSICENIFQQMVNAADALKATHE